MNAVKIFCLALYWGASPLSAKALEPRSEPMLRLPTEVSYLRAAPRGKWLSFSPSREGRGLSVINLQNGNIFNVTSGFVGATTSWSPDGARVFFREIRRVPGSKEPQSLIFAYDVVLHKLVQIDQISKTTGPLITEPRSGKLLLLHAEGIKPFHLYMPGQRHALWQLNQKFKDALFAAAPAGIMLVSEQGLKLRRMQDDGAELDSFAVSPDGQRIAWATTAGSIYMGTLDGESQFYAFGKDPSWHPTQPLLVYAGTRKVGKSSAGTDLRIGSLESPGHFATATQFNEERYPTWSFDGKEIYYTVGNSTDIFRLQLAENFLKPDTPQHERIEKFSAHFDPKPGTEALVEVFGGKTGYGDITVTPPKGTCWLITTYHSRPDQEVCKKTRLRFFLTDLSTRGEITWKVRTGGQDFGTDLTWPTPHRIARIIPTGTDFGNPSTPVFVKRCEARLSASNEAGGLGRHVRVHLFDGKIWTIRLPDRDVALPPPPPPPEKSEGGGSKKPEGPPPEAWTLATRRGFTMPSSYFTAADATTPGSKGACRYQFDEIPGDFFTGRVECHHTIDFTYVYVPLPCLGELRQEGEK